MISVLNPLELQTFLLCFLQVSTVWSTNTHVLFYRWNKRNFPSHHPIF